jgi:hypothetical protein
MSYMDTEEEVVYPNVATFGSGSQVVVRLMMTMEQADALKRIADWVRDDVSAKIDQDFADDLYITLNRTEEWS